MLKKDPEDVAPLLAKPIGREPLQTLVPRDGGDIETPRWTRDGKSIVYAHRQPDREGFLHHDLFLWTPEPHRVDRITHLADVADADPLPDGTHAVAVRSRDGYSQLVTVDLRSGEVAPMTEPSLDVVYAHPRASRDGVIAWSEHTKEGWRVVRCAPHPAGASPERSRRSHPLPAARGEGQPPLAFSPPCGEKVPEGRMRDLSVFSPEWSASGALHASVARRGFVDVARLDETGATPVTRVSGGAFDVAPAPDGSLYFMSLEPFGFVVRRLAAPVEAPQPPAASDALVPAVAPQPPKPVALTTSDVPPSRAYGIGRQELRFLFGGQYTTSGHTTEFGLRLGDVVGRLDTLFLGSRDGGAIATMWRGWPVGVGVHAFSLRDEHGFEARGVWSAAFPGARFSVAAGGLRLNGDDRAFVASRLFVAQRDQVSEWIDVAADSAQHARATVHGEVKLFGLRFGAALSGGRHISVGGIPTSLEPSSLFIARIADPALPRDTLVANSYRGERIEVRNGTVTLFVQRHRAGETRDIAGLETSLSLTPQPLLKAPALELLLGVARVRQEGRARGWVSIRWRP